jgi:hypothetical protein
MGYQRPVDVGGALRGVASDRLTAMRAERGTICRRGRGCPRPRVGPARSRVGTAPRIPSPRTRVPRDHGQRLGSASSWADEGHRLRPVVLRDRANVRESSQGCADAQSAPGEAIIVTVTASAESAENVIGAGSAGVDGEPRPRPPRRAACSYFESRRGAKRAQEVRLRPSTLFAPRDSWVGFSYSCPEMACGR